MRHAAVITCLLLACSTPALAQGGSSSNLMQSVFEKALYDKCLETAKPMVMDLLKKLGDLPYQDSQTVNVCRCTVNQLNQAPRMRSIFSVPIDQISKNLDDKANSNYLTGKTTTAMLICTGQQLDALLDR